MGPADWYFTEMASAEAFISGGKNEAIYLDPQPSSARTSVQFAARSPETLARACQKLQQLPLDYRPAGVDINMGCAALHIKRRGCGAALLDNPLLAQEMVAAARKNWPGLLSAKIRISTQLWHRGHSPTRTSACRIWHRFPYRSMRGSIRRSFAEKQTTNSQYPSRRS